MKRRGNDSVDSWVVAVATSMIFTLTSLPHRLGGLLFVSILDRYETNRKAASLPFALVYLLRSLSGPFAGYFGTKFGLQAVTLVGCIMCAVGVGGCFFAENIVTVDICLGIIYGFAFGWATALGPEFVNQHFNIHRAKANGLVLGGSSLGVFMFSPVLEIILRTFGVSGSFLIMSAILLNCIPASMFLKKPRSTKSAPNQLVPSATETSLPSVNNSENKCQYKTSTTNEHINTGAILGEESKGSSEIAEFCNLNSSRCIQNTDSKMKLKTNKTNSESSHSKIVINSEIQEFNTLPHNINSSQSNLNNSRKFLNNKVLDVKVTKEYIEQLHSELKDTPVMLINVCKLNDKPVSTDHKLNNIVFDKKTNNCIPLNKQCSFWESFDVLWSPIFLLITLVQSSHHYVMYVSWTIIIDVVRDKAIQSYLHVYYLMAMTLFDTFGRLLCGFITDKCMTNANFSACCFISMSLSCFVISFVSGSTSTMICYSIFGLMIGGNTTALPGILTEYIEKEKRSMAMASRLILFAPMSFTMSPLIGYFRGNLGSYDGLLYTLSSICLVCSALLFLLNRVDSCLRNRKLIHK